MTHDPLCPYRPSTIQCNKDHKCGSGIIIPESKVKCQCDLIAIVRADQDRRHQEELMQLCVEAVRSG